MRILSHGNGSSPVDACPASYPCKNCAKGPLNILKITKEEVATADLPALLPAAGFTPDRVVYLCKHIRPHVSPAFQDDLCPCPEGGVEDAGEADDADL